MMTRISHAAMSVALAALVGCGTTARPPASHAEAEVRAVLEQSVRDWNAGDLAGFMEAYAKSGQTRFASGGDVVLGWRTVLDRYQRKYGSRAAMGTLNFSDVDVTTLGPDTALAFGHWHLKRDADAPQGLFTLLFRKSPEGWRIVHDHSSSANL